MNKKVKANLSGALWLFTTVIFLLGTLNGYAKSAWILLIIAAGVQTLLEAYYHSKITD